jgi:hypothetical protein
LRDYLLENDTKFPLYLNPGDGIDVINPHSQDMLGGFFLGYGEDDCFLNYDFPK